MLCRWNDYLDSFQVRWPFKFTCSFRIYFLKISRIFLLAQWRLIPEFPQRTTYIQFHNISYTNKGKLLLTLWNRIRGVDGCEWSASRSLALPVSEAYVSCENLVRRLASSWTAGVHSPSPQTWEWSPRNFPYSEYSGLLSHGWSKPERKAVRCDLVLLHLSNPHVFISRCLDKGESLFNISSNLL